MSTETDNRDRLFTEYSEFSDGTQETNQENCNDYIERLTKARRSYRSNPFWKGFALWLFVIAVIGIALLEVSPNILETTIKSRFDPKNQNTDLKTYIIGNVVPNLLLATLLCWFGCYFGIRTALIMLVGCLLMVHISITVGITSLNNELTLIACNISSWLSQIGIFVLIPVAIAKWTDRKHLGRDFGIVFAALGAARLCSIKLWDYVTHGKYHSFEILVWLLFIPTVISGISIFIWVYLDRRADQMESHAHANRSFDCFPKPRDLKQIDKLSIIACVINCFASAAVVMFTKWVLISLNESKSYETELIPNYALVIFFSQITGSFITGFFNDVLGYRGHSILFGAFCGFIGFFAILVNSGLLRSSATVPLTLISIAQGIILTSAYSSTCLIIPQKVYGVVFGSQIFIQGMLNVINRVVESYYQESSTKLFENYAVNLETTLMMLTALVLAILLLATDRQEKLKRPYNF